MKNTIKNHYPVRDYGLRIYIKPLEAIDLSVVCDESQISDRVREYADYIIDEVVSQVEKQLENIELYSGIAVVEKRPANWMDDDR